MRSISEMQARLGSATALDRPKGVSRHQGVVSKLWNCTLALLWINAPLFAQTSSAPSLQFEHRGEDVQTTFLAQPFTIYNLMASSSLSGPWTPVTNLPFGLVNPVFGSGRFETITETGLGSADRRFYRLDVIAQDADANGGLTSTEFAAGQSSAMTPALRAAVFASWDTNGDNKLNQDEYRLKGLHTPPVVPGMNDWLASVNSELYYTELGLTHSHDAAAYKFPGVSMISQTYLTQAGYNLYHQFVGGVRLFDLLTSPESVADRSTFRFAHGKYEVGDTSDEAFRQLFTALANNPSEFIGFNLKPYNGLEDDFKSNNAGKHFWDTGPGKLIHSYFFIGGSALQGGTPRVWGNDVFSQWGLDQTLPEEKKALLRGKPLFYIPRFGQQNPTIPKLKDLRGKFMFADESGFGRMFIDPKGYLSLDHAHRSKEQLQAIVDANPNPVAKADDQAYLDAYIADMPAWPEYRLVDYNKDTSQWTTRSAFGFTYQTKDADISESNPWVYRFDGSDFYYYYKQRYKNRNFIDIITTQLKKPAKWPSFIALNNSLWANVATEFFSQEGLYLGHDLIWHEGGYSGDNGSPCFQDVILDGRMLAGNTTPPFRVAPPKVGTITGIYFTDFAAQPTPKPPTNRGLSPAAVIVQMQPRVLATILNDVDTNGATPQLSLLQGGSPTPLRIRIQTNIPEDHLSDSLGNSNYAIVVTLLSASLTNSPSVVNGYGAEVELAGSIFVAKPQGEQELRLNVPKGNTSQQEYISIQVKDLRTNKLFGAPRIYGLPPVN
jgi:hypothetical protein